jgi:hypothetical protein
MAFYVLRRVIEHAAFVVMRTYESVVVTPVETFLPTLPAHMHQHWTNISDRLVTSNHKDAHGIIFRLVEWTIGDTTYRLRTNRFDLTTYHILLMYADRWQIERMVRFLKRTLGCLKVITHRPAGMETFFAGMLLTAILQSYFKIDCLVREGSAAPELAATSSISPGTSAVHRYDTPESGGENLDSTSSAESVRTLADQTDQIAVSCRKVQTSIDTKRPTIISDVALFMNEINQKTALFWKIPKHWINTVRDCLHWQFAPEVVNKLNKRALQYAQSP